ncbi:unnamed protein product [Durusdinium trenchii]|uniref:Uncharacterized protein n=2 Tax=Durusdinium trenchii TaxID=1381693 RepID=A0ABP0PI57_9DINO
MGELDSRRNRARRVCSSLHRLLSCVDHLWQKLRVSCKRRRNSQKRVLFYTAQGIASLGVMIAAIVLYQIILATATSLGDTCGSTVPTNDTDLKAQVLSTSSAVECSNDAFGLSACEYGDLLNVANMMYANFYVNGLQFLVCMIMIYSLGKFTHLPAEKLQFDKKNASRLMMLFGGICKQGPWLTRLLHFVQGILLFGSWLMMILGYCQGNLAYTSACTAYSEGCAYNKARNCQYYYTYCKPDATLLLGCYTQAGRAAFSGRMDIRVLSGVHCVACGILEADAANVMGTDEFYLLDDDSRGTDAWVCNEQLDGCFHTTAWSSIKCGVSTTGGSCEASLGGVVTAAYLSDTLASIACARRLDERRLNETADETAGDDDAADAADDGDDAADGDAGDDGDSDTATSTVTSQQCSWGNPSIEDYFFESSQCTQAGSLVYRLSMLYIYFAGCSYAVFTIFGQIVRLLLNPEPWFFNPVTADENCIFKFLRKVAP